MLVGGRQRIVRRVLKLAFCQPSLTRPAEGCLRDGHRGPGYGRSGYRPGAATAAWHRGRNAGCAVNRDGPYIHQQLDLLPAEPVDECRLEHVQ